MKLTIEQTLQLGVAAHKEGKLEEAEQFYRAILQSQPLHPDANHNLGVLAVSVNKTNAALPLFKTALEANPKIEQFWLSYIDSLIKTEEIDNARGVIAEARQAGVTAEKLQLFDERFESELSHRSHIRKQKISNLLQSHQGELLAAIELREVGKYKEAQEWLRNLICHDPKNVEALTLLSQVLLLDKKNAEAERVLTEAASINSEHPSVYRNQARLLLKQSKTSEALEKAQLGYKQLPEDLESLLLLAACLGANQRDLEALPIIEKILKAEPNCAEAYANRAFIKLRAKDTLSAIKDAEMTVSLKPHLTQMWFFLYSLYYQSGNLSDAIEALRNAHKNEPKNPAFMIQLGELLRQDNKGIEAINILEKATELAPKDANAWTNLGVSYQQENRIADTKIAYGKALAINPKSASIASNLGSMAKDDGEWESALRYFKKALEIEPNFAAAHSNFGAMLKELGRLEDAEVSFTQSIALKPDFAEAHYNLGIMLKELGRLEDAEASYKKAIALKPGYDEAHNKLLKCLYLLDKQSFFVEKLDCLINENKVNATIGSLTHRSALKYGLEKPNLFCREPLEYVYHIDMNALYNFEEIFVKKARLILNENRLSKRNQTLLLNGSQTSRNLFEIKNSFTEQIQKAIQLEIEKYHIKFQDSKEGFIKKWPTEYSLYGWLISMKNGGQLNPHIHENGWLSGSLYINVPPKLKAESGNLVLSLGEKKDEADTRINEEKIINVVTGSLVLFPASLTHYTIPFEAEEDRIVLAFDVKQK